MAASIIKALTHHFCMSHDGSDFFNFLSHAWGLLKFDDNVGIPWTWDSPNENLGNFSLTSDGRDVWGSCAILLEPHIIQLARFWQQEVTAQNRLLFTVTHHFLPKSMDMDQSHLN